MKIELLITIPKSNVFDSEFCTKATRIFLGLHKGQIWASKEKKK